MSIEGSARPLYKYKLEPVDLVIGLLQKSGGPRRGERNVCYLPDLDGGILDVVAVIRRFYSRVEGPFRAFATSAVCAGFIANTVERKLTG